VLYTVDFPVTVAAVNAESQRPHVRTAPNFLCSLLVAVDRVVL